MWVATRRATGRVALLLDNEIVWMSYGEARERLEEVLDAYSAPVPEGLREVSRLRRDGIMDLSGVFTWRQLLTLLTFVREAEALGCGRVARLAAGYVARTASLLAFYYQPYGKINPALVIKSYWVPRNPAELNPTSYMEGRKYPRSLGRGTLTTFVRRYCLSCGEGGAPGEASVTEGDALRYTPSERPYILMTDPPYPGYQSYQELALLYHYFLHYPRTQEMVKAITSAKRNPFAKKKDYIRFINEFTAKVSKIRPSITAVFLGISRPSDADIVATLAKGLRRSHDLIRLYWFLGELPGKLGRTTARGVFVTVAANKELGDPSRDPTEPLKWAIDSLSALDEDIDGDHERSIIEAVIEQVSGIQP